MSTVKNVSTTELKQKGFRVIKLSIVKDQKFIIPKKSNDVISPRLQKHVELSVTSATEAIRDPIPLLAAFGYSFK